MRRRRSRSSLLPRESPLLFLCFIATTTASSDKKTEITVGSELPLDDLVANVYWFGPDDSSVLVLSRSGRIYRSSNHGDSWEDSSAILSKASGNLNVQVNISRVIKSRASSEICLLHAKDSGVFLSDDRGQSWTKLNVSSSMVSWSFHYSRPLWALTSWWSDGCADGDACTHDLYLTKDLGKTFEKIAYRIVQFSWGAVDHKQEDRIYFTKWSTSITQRQKKLTRWTTDVDLYWSNDFGKQHTLVVRHGNKFQISDRYMLTVRTETEVPQSIRLMVSSDGDTFQETHLPHTLLHRSFFVLDTSEDAIVLHVGGRSNTIGDIYTSDSKGITYSVSLLDNQRQDGVCAFERVVDVKGIYVANVYKAGRNGIKEAKKPADKHDDENAPPPGLPTEGETFQAPSTIRFLAAKEDSASDGALFDDAEGDAVLARADAEHRASRKGSRSFAASTVSRRFGHGRRLNPSFDIMNNFLGVSLRTVVTFDKGGVWQNVKAPDAQASSCSTVECNLHLHSFADFFVFAPVYSYKNAVGILMGSGNVGSRLSYNANNLNTYLSRDSGLTWEEVKKGSWIYEYGNHGGLVVIADMSKPSTNIEYTSDEGKTWFALQISDTPVHIENILIEPDASSTKFVVYGTRSAGKGFLRKVDFGALHPNVCSGVAIAGEAGSDYETWSPSESLGGNCLLGHKNIYVRRKRAAKCTNSEHLERASRKNNCVCAKGDFECGIGFLRAVGSTECNRDPNEIIEACLGQPNGKFLTVDAYRKIPGNTCEGGYVPEKVSIQCQESSPPHLSSPPHFDETATPAAKASQAVAPAVPEKAKDDEGGGSSIFLAFTCLISVALLLALRKGKVCKWLSGGDEYRTVTAAKPPAPKRRARDDAEMVGAPTCTNAGEYQPPSF